MVERRYRRVFWHFFGWIIYFLINFYNDIFFERQTFASILFILCFFAATVLIFYFFYCFVAPKFLKGKRLLVIPILFSAAIFFQYALQEKLPFILLGYEGGSTYNSLLEFFTDNFFQVFIPAAAGTLLFLFEKGKRDEANALRLLNEKNEAELSFLRSQINPHFLFNTMNFLYAKAYKHDEYLAESILRLSDVMRYTLKNSELEKVKIAEEIKLIKDIIAIFEARFDGNCFVSLEIEGKDFNQQFEPLLLMPFVENAFKHGIYNQKEHPLHFYLNVSEGKLFFRVKNKIKHQQKDAVSGIGISNLRRRLNLMYPNNYDLNVKDDGVIYQAELNVRLEHV